MLRLALAFLLVAVLAFALGAPQAGQASMGAAQLLFYVFIVLFVLVLLAGLVRGAGSGFKDLW